MDEKGFRSTGIPDRYLDDGLVQELNRHRMVLGCVNNLLYRVDYRYVRNGWALRATPFLALLVL